jgi:hypothetical protein
MRIQVLALLAVWGIPAGASTLVDFNIVNSSTFSNGGGSFTSGNGGVIPGTYSGWFQVDVSNIPTDGRGIALSSWDVFTTGSSILGNGLDAEFTPTDGLGFLVPSLPMQFDSRIGSVQLDDIRFQAAIPAQGLGQHAFILDLYVLEPVGTFHGGLVYDASEQDLTALSSQSDFTGTGFVLDPAVLPAAASAPEADSGLLMAAGLGLIGLGAAARRVLIGSALPEPRRSASRLH